jgi:hypothetical protein
MLQHRVNIPLSSTNPSIDHNPELVPFKILIEEKFTDLHWDNLWRCIGGSLVIISYQTVLPGDGGTVVHT